MVLTRHQSEAASSEEPQAEAARARGAAPAEALGARRRDAALNPNQQQTFTPESPSPPQQTEDVLQWRARLDEHLRRVSQRDEERDEAAGGYSTPSGDNHALRERRVPPAPRPLDRAAREIATRGNRSLTPDAADRAATQRPGTPAPREPRTFDRDRNLEQVRFEDEQRAPSVTSRASSTTLARKKEAELQAAERLAEIKRQQLQLEEELVKKRLDAELQRIEAEGSQAGGSQSGRPLREPAAEATRRVDAWFDRHEVSDAVHNNPTPRRRRDATHDRPEHETRTSRERSSSRSQAIDRLADHLQTMARPPPRQVYELPTYSGHPSEWLTFYHSFSESTKRYKFTDYENVARLRAALKGEARECVQHMLASTSNPDLIIRVLKKNFGRTDLLVDRALEELKRLPTLGPSALDLNTFAIKVMNIVSTLVDLDRRNYGGNPLLIREITERLSPHLRSRWCSYAKDNVRSGECEIIILAEFLMDESDAELLYSHARAPSRRPAPIHSQTQPPPPRRATHLNQGASGAIRRPLPVRAQTYAAERTDGCLYCGNNHRTYECRKLLAMTVRARWEWARSNHICFKCMNQKHRRETCVAKGCSVTGCPHSHHAILHEPNRSTSVSTSDAGNNARTPPPRAPAPPSAPLPVETATINHRRDAEPSCDVTSKETIAATSHTNSKVMLKIIPLILRGPIKEVLCYGMIDEGSTISIVDQELANEVGLQGPQAPLTIQGVGAICLQQPSQRVEASVRGVGGGPAHTMQLRTVPQLGIREQSMPRESIMRLPHLAGLQEACYSGVTPRVLIGADHWHLTLPLEARTGRRSEPIAVRSELGWCIYGCTPRTLRTTETVMHLEASDPDRELTTLLRRYFDVDSLGVKLIDKASPLDERAKRLFDDSVRRVEGPRYEVGQLWRTDEPNLPPSYNMAYKRLRNLEQKMDRDPDFAEEYSKQITNLLDKGYAEPHHGDISSPKTWFLPHFAVRNPNKPGRVRLVFDAHAATQGTCLNDELLEGPDLLRSLIGILLRFREGEFAATADIQEMFLRIKLKPEDQMSQLFLWRGSDRQNPPKVYKVASVMFGAKSSPFIAHSVRNRNAMDNAELYPAAVYDITHNTYMDDLVSSYDDEDAAADTAAQIIASHAMGGFNLRGWATNSNKIRIRIPPEQRAEEPKSLGHKELKVLGMCWNHETDDLGFNTSMVRVPADVRNLTRGPTKREALSAVMSVFDPLGQIAQYSITAKVQLQRICVLKVGWDEPLPEREQQLFLQWLSKLNHVAELRLPRRCLYTGGDSRHELHVFTDASEQAYAAAAYWRTEGRPGDPVRVQLIAARSKVTPIRPISIPRAELQAALIGARLARTLSDEHRVTANRIILWTDSRTVLQWVRDNARRYSTFVSHRLGEIAEITEPDQWRWVPTRANPADDATRADPERVIKNTDRWYTGPDFLKQPEDRWPQEVKENIEPSPEIIEVCNTLQVTDPPLPRIERFSNFDRLIGATARALLFIERLKKKVRVPLEVRHHTNAEHLWMQWSQRRDFPEELRALSRGEPISRSSRLYELDPQLCDDGLMRMKTRINAAPSFVNKRPILLDGRNPYVKLLILRAHKRAHHAFNETVVNDLRQQYWILHLRPAVRSAARTCMYCVLRRARPRDPPLGDLPAARLQPFTRAFNFCAVDLFGPQTVAIGRRVEKRWVALFTCLTTRAVHLEVVHTLSTDSAIMALRRLGARRGWPSVMYSDNGTNLRGCDAELKAAYAEWLPALQEHGQLHRMTWRFIAPGAPRQGGAWERMVRTVKTALSATLHARSPKEEIFKTLLAEVEHTVNSRPLTHVSVEPDDPEALTPNHFLLGGSSGVPITGPCDEHDRKAWRACQALADSFWRRWLREYVPLLAPRGSSSPGDHAITVGDYVLVADPNLPRNTWPRGIVDAVYPGPDGVTRNVDVRTRGGVFRRPTTKLAVLPINKGSPPRSDRGEDVADASNVTSHEPIENLS